MWEFYTIGGGELIVDILNGLAAITNSVDYEGLIYIALLIGAIWMLLILAFTNSWDHALKWFLGTTLIYGALLAPKQTVIVRDTLNPALPAASISNVPLGVTVIGSLSTSIGHYLTDMAETAFTLPNDLTYQQTGMLYGSRLYRQVTQVRITDPEYG